jgi:hypothetical protein
VALFMLSYVFATFSAEAAAERQGRCPLQVAGYRGRGHAVVSSAQPTQSLTTAPRYRGGL